MCGLTSGDDIAYTFMLTRGTPGGILTWPLQRTSSCVGTRGGVGTDAYRTCRTNLTPPENWVLVDTSLEMEILGTRKYHHLYVY